MKKTLLASSIAIAISSLSMNNHAEKIYYDPQNTNNTNTQKSSDILPKKDITETSFVNEKYIREEDYELAIIESEEVTKALHKAEKNIALLQKKLTYEKEASNYYKNALAQLEFQILFHTGKDTIDKRYTKHLDELALFLQTNSEFNIYLHGHTDPRGTDEYNNVLSMHRAINVQEALVNRGVDLARIKRRAYGSKDSQANKGHLDAYALERRVSIKIFNPKPKNLISIAM